MKRFNWRTFLVLLGFLSTTVFAADVIWGETDEDIILYNEVLLDGIELPEDMGTNTLKSSVDFLGTGSLTVAYQIGGGYPRITVFGGTTITSQREWSEDDEKQVWDGLLQSPLISEIPDTEKIIFVTEGNHEYSTLYPIQAFKLGLENEKFQFSTPARFSFNVDVPDGKKLWYGYKETKSPEKEDDVEWRIEEGDFCIVKNGLCVTDLEELNAVILSQEFFTKCPQSRSSDTEIRNGYIVGIPTCDIECNKGYELNEFGNGCVLSDDADGDLDKEEKELLDIQTPTTESEEVRFTVPQGYVRYTGAGDQMRRKLDSSILEGSEKDQIERQNAALLKSISHGEEAVIDDEKNGDSGFLNYLLQVRNYFGENASANVFSGSEEAHESEKMDEMIEIKGDKTERVEGDMYSSAPLLPSTGPGIFVGLAALGLGLMIFGVKSRH